MLEEKIQPYIDSFILEKLKRNQTSEAESFKCDLKVFQRFLKERPYIKEISELCRMDIEDYLSYLSKVEYNAAFPYRPSYVYRKLRALMKFLEYLTIHADGIPKSYIPQAGIIDYKDFPAPNKRGVKHFPIWYDKFIHERILALPKDKRTIKFRTMLLTCYHTGIRNFDLCTLEKNCLFSKYNRHWIRIYGNKVKREYEIPIEEELYEAIIEYKKVMKKELEKKVIQLHPTTNKRVVYLFTNNGTPQMFKHSFSEKLKKFVTESFEEAKKEGYDTSSVEKLGITSHKFRHNVAIKLLRSGADPMLIAEFLGHNGVAMAQAYIQEDDDYINDVFQELEEDDFDENVSNLEPIIIKRNDLMNHSGVVSKVVTGWCTHFNNETPCGENPYQCWLCENLKPNDTEEYKDYLQKQKKIHEELLERNKTMGFEKAIDAEEKVLKRIKEFIEIVEDTNDDK